MFSDRIWQNKEILGRNLRLGLTQSMILGESFDKIAERINKGIETAKYNAMRVARSEVKRVSYVTHAEVYKENNLERVKRRVANNGNDKRVCSICRKLNGEEYELGKEPTLPTHPNCRCIYVPIVPDTFKENELNELTNSIRGSENYGKWKKQQEKELKQAQLLQEVSEKQQEVEKAEAKLITLNKMGGKDGVYSGIWKDDVTVKDYLDKKNAINLKKDYFTSKLSKTTGAEYDKFSDLLQSLDDFEKNGKLYEKQVNVVRGLKKELVDLQKEAGVYVDNPFSQERKDNAYWFKNKADGDSVLRKTTGDFWRKCSKEEKKALYEYTAGSGSYNRPLAGFKGGWHPKNKVGVNKLSIDYEGSGSAIRKMTTAIDRSSYDFDIWLQRGCGNEAMESFFNLEFNTLHSYTEKELQKYIGYKGKMTNFISTGASKGQGFSGNVILNIYAPKGTKMVYAEPFSYYGKGAELAWDGISKQSEFGYEFEMIIQRGATYRVTKIEKKYGTIYMDLEVRPELGYDKFQQRKYFKE